MAAIEILRAEAPHLLFSVVAAVIFCALVGMLGKRTRRERLAHSSYLFMSCAAWIIGGSWLMRLIHG